MSISVVVPICNERENIVPLHRQLSEVLPSLGREYEIVLVDDGSTDGTCEELRRLAEGDPNVKVVLLRRNFGQTAALQAGFDLAGGDIIVTLDGDLQNDPQDIPLLVAKLEEGFDLVHGWRQDRQDAWLTRRIPSQMANWLISRVTGLAIHDLGCTLKAMRREIAEELELYGEMHRFIPILAHRRGARCVEVVTRHHERRFGRTKYGLGRTPRVILDLITVKFLLDYFASPMKLFGAVGLGCLCMALLSASAAVGMSLLGQTGLLANPLSLLAVLLGMGSLQFFGLGLVGEVNARIYFAGPGKTSYAVRETLNVEARETVKFESRRAA